MRLIQNIVPEIPAKYQLAPPVEKTNYYIPKNTIEDLRHTAEQFWSRSRIPWGVPLNLWDNNPKLAAIIQNKKDKSRLPRGTPK
jgi:hypothetical protein